MSDTSSDSSAYELQSFYLPLSVDNREIRLLHLPSRKDEDTRMLRCRLSTVSLDSHPVYEALSYTWGQPTEKTNIKIYGDLRRHLFDLDDTEFAFMNDRSVLIPSNLCRFLERLRYEDKERILWADAICIDQSNIPERNQQVAMMADIYRKCQRCLIWLDGVWSHLEFTDSLLPLLSGLSKKRHLHEPEAPSLGWAMGPPQIPLMEIIGCSWWHRMWVVQEVILAPQSLVIYGSLEMTFSDLVRAVEFVNEHDLRESRNATGQDTSQACDCLDYIKVTFIWADLLTLRDNVYRLLKVTDVQHSEHDQQPMPALAGTSVELPDIVNVMLSVRNRVCSDPRDKVFAVLSLVKEWRSWQPIIADYSEDTLTVYTKLATQLMNSDIGARTLLLAQGCDSSSASIEGLPSWAPDWTKPGPGYERYLLNDVAGRKHRTETTPLPPSILGSTLKLGHAVRLGKITKVSSRGNVPGHSGGQLSGSTYAARTRHVQTIESWLNFANVHHNLSFREVLLACIDASKAAAEITAAVPAESAPHNNDDDHDNSNDSGSYARLMADLSHSDQAVDFMPDIRSLFAIIRRYQRELRYMDDKETIFYRTLVHGIYPAHLSREPRYDNEALSILRILLMMFHDFVDPDRCLTRLNSLVLIRFAEILERLRTFSDRVLFRLDDDDDDDDRKTKLGIGPAGLREGDEVFCFEGIWTPFVLRTKESPARTIVQSKSCEEGGEEAAVKDDDTDAAAASQRQNYVLIGDCYVDGTLTEDLDFSNGVEVYLD